jgi:hypothetical protein
MAKIKYDNKGIDRGGGNYEQPQPGLYEVEIKEANLRDTNGKNDIEVVLEITKNNSGFVGSRLWSYCTLGENRWRFAELCDALGLPEKGELDTSKLVGKKLKVKVNADSYNNEYRARVGRFVPLDSVAAEADAADDPDAGGGGDPDDPDAGTAAAGGGDEPKVVELNDVELSNDPDFYAEWSDDEVFEEVDNQSLTIKGKQTREKVIEALVALVDEQDGDGEGDEPESEDGDNYDDEDAWSDKDLADEVKRRGLEIEGKKSRVKFIAALRADDAGDDDPFKQD